MSRSISHFIHWAHMRLQKELEDIEMMEREYGTAEWLVKKDDRKRRPSYTKKEKRRLVAEVDKLKKKGYTYRIAARTLNIDPSTYCKWKKQLQSKRNTKSKASKLKST